MAGGLVKTALQGANLGDAVNVIFAVSDYKNARQEGDNAAVSVAKAAGSFAWGEMVFGGVGAAIERKVIGAGLTGGKAAAAMLGGNVAFMAGYMAVSAIPQLVSTVGQHTTNVMGKSYNRAGKFGSGSFQMTDAGYTMRQRSLNAIRQNGLNTQSALGNEARTYFRGSY
jgi:hypothetical protein